MKRRVTQLALETFQKRIEDVKELSKQDPYLDSYALQKKLIQELIELLKTTPEYLVDVELLRWIQRQESAGAAASSQAQLQKDMNELDEILQSENEKQMTLDDFISSEEELEKTRNIKEVELPASEHHQGLYTVKVKLRWSCPGCGMTRGNVERVRSYDGSLWLTCDGWNNPCGHVDRYDKLRIEAKTNGLNS